MERSTLADLVRNYIVAKDSNRPHLLSRTFAPLATLTMVVKTDAIAFPPEARGLDAIADMLVRRFAQRYENVYTFCLCEPPPPAALRLDCAWLVVMTEKETQQLCAGFGRYVWDRRPDELLVERLSITIEKMERFGADLAAAAFQWAERLPYPWCAIEQAGGGPGPLQALVRDAAGD